MLNFFLLFLTSITLGCSNQNVQPLFVNEIMLKDKMSSVVDLDLKLEQSEKKLARQLCENFRRKVVALDQEKERTDLSFLIVHESCRGKRGERGLVSKVTKVGDNFELMGPQIDGMVYRIETHENGLLHHICQGLLSENSTVPLSRYLKHGEEYWGYFFYPAPDKGVEVLILYADYPKGKKEATLKKNKLMKVYRAETIIFSGSYTFETYRRVVTACSRETQPHLEKLEITLESSFAN